MCIGVPFGALIFHWRPEVLGKGGGGRIARGTLGAIPVMSRSNVRMETDGQNGRRLPGVGLTGS